MPMESGKCYISHTVIILELFSPPLETLESYTVYQQETRNAKGDSVKQIQIGQRVLENNQSTLTTFQRKRGLGC
jgi:hypothetical protein